MVGKINYKERFEWVISINSAVHLEACVEVGLLVHHIYLYVFSMYLCIAEMLFSLRKLSTRNSFWRKKSHRIKCFQDNNLTIVYQPKENFH